MNKKIQYLKKQASSVIIKNTFNIIKFAPTVIKETIVITKDVTEKEILIIYE